MWAFLSKAVSPLPAADQVNNFEIRSSPWPRRRDSASRRTWRSRLSRRVGASSAPAGCTAHSLCQSVSSQSHSSLTVAQSSQSHSSLSVDNAAAASSAPLATHRMEHWPVATPGTRDAWRQLIFKYLNSPLLVRPDELCANSHAAPISRDFFDCFLRQSLQTRLAAS